ncbi:MobV family relaxase [Bacillus sp. OV322]|uniref:MobV family relaxase n=1 Tax=Bacillus sp. OV322 TaxID=1882764 RepID=UPI00210EC3D8|nr:MobV family relaxase [Bacillus sp. OV322]
MIDLLHPKPEGCKQTPFVCAWRRGGPPMKRRVGWLNFLNAIQRAPVGRVWAGAQGSEFGLAEHTFTNVKYSVLYFMHSQTLFGRWNSRVSYAVCRMQKMKSHDLKGMQFHNQRERESRTNDDIDPAKINLNYDLVNDVHIDYNLKVKSIIEAQKTDERKIRKDAVLVNELLITSDKLFFEGLSEPEQKRFFKEGFELFSERYGKQNIAYATVHMDEKTPHLHLGIVPMRDGKLQGKNVFNRQELQWIQNEFPKHMQGLGFDVQRGEENSKREHLTVQQFKAKTLKEQIQELEQSKTDLEGDLTSTNQQLYVLRSSLNALETHAKDIDRIEGKRRILRDDVLIKAEELETLKNYAKKLPAVILDNQKLSQERDAYQSKNEQLNHRVGELGKEKNSLIKENLELKQELSKFKRLYSYAKQFLVRINLFEKFLQVVKMSENERQANNQHSPKEKSRKKDIEFER